MKLLGAILAGGDSQRMGSDKASLDTGAGTWWSRQRDLLLRCGCEEIVILRKPGQSTPAGIPCIRDIHVGQGPLAGIQAVLQATQADLILVVAVDMQRLESDWFQILLRACTDMNGAAFEHASGIEPLAAIYPKAASHIALARIEEGRLGMQNFVRDLEGRGLLRLVPLPTHLAGQCGNLNSPEELRGPD